jgi:hypothetical protein
MRVQWIASLVRSCDFTAESRGERGTLSSTGTQTIGVQDTLNGSWKSQTSIKITTSTSVSGGGGGGSGKKVA